MKKKRYLLGFLLLLVFTVFGCDAQEAPVEKVTEPVVQDVQQEAVQEPVPVQEIEEETEVEEEIIPKTQTTLTFSRKIKVADAVFPGIFSADGNFYVTYNKNNDVYVKKFDTDFKEIEEKKLTNVNKVNDIQVAHGNGFFYVVYSTPGKSGAPDKGLYLKKFDLDFNEVKSIAITEEAPKTEATNDMFLSLIGDLLHVGTFYIPANPGPGNNFGHNIRVYDKDFNLKKEFAANDLNHQNGASLIFVNDKFTIVSGANINFNNQNRDLITLSYDKDWNFLNDGAISNEPDDEYWPMGSFFDKDTIYIAYISNEKFNPQFCSTCDMGDIYLKRYGENFNLIDKTIVADEFPSQRPHLLKVGNKVYVAYDSSENNQLKIYVKEFAEQ